MPTDYRNAILYFDLTIHIGDVEEVAGNPDDYDPELVQIARVLIDDRTGLEWVKVEGEGLRVAARLLGRSVGNEGHAADGALVCKVPVGSREELEDLWHRLGPSVDREIAPFVTLSGVTYYPDGVNNVRVDDLDDYLTGGEE